MDLLRHVCYVIKARRDLARFLQGHLKLDAAKHILRPPIYHTEERTDTTWSVGERILKVKLLFLNAIRTREPFRKDEDFSAVFGSVRINEAMFDQWWTVERLEAEQDLVMLNPYMKHATEPIGPTGSAKLDELLEDLRKCAMRMRPSITGSVIFHNRDLGGQISPLVFGSWNRPIIEVFEEAFFALGPAGNDAYDYCAEFVGWCCSRNPRPGHVSLFNFPGVPSVKSEMDQIALYDKFMATIAKWDKPPFLFDLEKNVITHRGKVLWPSEKRSSP